MHYASMLIITLELPVIVPAGFLPVLTDDYAVGFGYKLMRCCPVLFMEKDAVMSRMHLVYAHGRTEVHVYLKEIPAVAEHMI